MYYKINSKLFKDSYKLFCSSGQFRENHYETLNLPRNCTSKDIRERFIKLSKEHHPDMNKSKDAHAEFLKIQEAYNILSKKSSRRDYDLGLSNPYASTQNMHQNIYYHQPYGRNPWNDPSFWANRDKNEDDQFKSRPYYGIDGIERVSNASIVVLCIILSIIGVTLQILAVRQAVKQVEADRERNSFTIRRDEMTARSNEYLKEYQEVKRQAEVNGNKVQLALLKKRLMVDDDDDDGDEKLQEATQKFNKAT